MNVSAQSLLRLLLFVLLASTVVAQQKPLDPCRLLSPAEIQHVQGSAPTSTRGTSQDNVKLSSRQCFFNLDPFAQSISLQVMEQPAQEKITARQLWAEKFHGDKKREDAEDEDRKAPRPVAGVGEEAFWVNSGRDGALYTLQGRYILRIGIGGKDGEQIMLQHATALTKFALQKLPATTESNQ